jgi:hypothetical protein
VLERLLPLPYLEDWRTRADDCLIFGSSLVGARKYYLGEPLVKYRLHQANSFAGKVPDARADYRHRVAINRLFQHIVTRQGYDTVSLPELAHREFQTIPRPTFRHLTDYFRLVFGSRLRLSRKLAQAGAILGHYVHPGRNCRADTVSEPGNAAPAYKTREGGSADEPRSAA